MARRRPVALATVEAATLGRLLIPLGIVLLGLDLAERPGFADVGWFIAVALVFAGLLAFFGRRLVRDLSSRVVHEPAPATVESPRGTVWRLARGYVLWAVIVVALTWALGDEFREDMLDSFGGFAFGVGASWLLQERWFRAIERRSGGTLVHERRFRWSSPSADYYLERPAQE